MSLHTSLEIFGTVYALFGVVVDATKAMPRDAKPVLGSLLVQHSLELTTLLRRANRALDKSQDLEALLERKDEIEILLRVSVEKMFISRALYGKAIQLTQSVGRQASGWRKSSSSAPVARPSRQPGPSDVQSGRAAGSQGHRNAR